LVQRSSEQVTISQEQRFASTMPVITFSLAAGVRLESFEVVLRNVGPGPAIHLEVALAIPQLVRGPRMTEVATSLPFQFDYERLNRVVLAAGDTVSVRFSLGYDRETALSDAEEHPLYGGTRDYAVLGNLQATYEDVDSRGRKSSSWAEWHPGSDTVTLSGNSIRMPRFRPASPPVVNPTDWRSLPRIRRPKAE
jgi:hypothetical protein